MFLPRTRPSSSSMFSSQSTRPFRVFKSLDLLWSSICAEDQNGMRRLARAFKEWIPAGDDRRHIDLTAYHSVSSRCETAATHAGSCLLFLSLGCFVIAQNVNERATRLSLGGVISRPAPVLSLPGCHPQQQPNHRSGSLTIKPVSEDSAIWTCFFFLFPLSLHTHSSCFLLSSQYEAAWAGTFGNGGGGCTLPFVKKQAGNSRAQVLPDFDPSSP